MYIKTSDAPKKPQAKLHQAQKVVELNQVYNSVTKVTS